mmetsp:Transcript_128490/g.247634  ORF Transcript_128490/g.247634 Transcript_128490/m.247634 type:complete len:482 (+) Transcript_128490:78-1523(+)
MNEVQTTAASSSNCTPWRVVEFFAGMGGMRAAAAESGIPLRIVASYEISNVCAKAYWHNYGREGWQSKTIDSLPAADLDALRADTWLMSPPCQPFTRCGRRLDQNDNRTLALRHLIRVLPTMRCPPQRILLENVIGFEASECRRQLLEGLAAMGWEAAEFGLDAVDFGLPNRRPRYYGLFRMPCSPDLSAEQFPKHPEAWPRPPVAEKASPAAEGASPSLAQGTWCCCWQSVGALLRANAADDAPAAAVSTSSSSSSSSPASSSPALPGDAVGDEGRELAASVPDDGLLQTWSGAGAPPPLGEFLQMPEEIAREESELGVSLEVPESIMSERMAKDGRFDIHLRSDRTSACLTKANGRLPRGFSPLVLIDEAEAGTLEQLPKISAQGLGPGASTDHIWHPGVRVRYLSPTEQLRLMGYPASYTFPGGLSFRDRCSLVGNSLNVRVVAWLLPLFNTNNVNGQPDEEGSGTPEEVLPDTTSIT